MAFDEVTISDDDDGQRLDRVLRRLRPSWPYVLVQKLLRKGAVKIDGKRAKVDARVTAGQVVRMPKDEEENRSSQGAPRAGSRSINQPLDILYEDQDILILNKPTGLAVQGGSGLTVHLEMLLDPYAQHGVAPRLVHRLDRDTSGVLVLARTARAARRLSDQFATRQVEKVYDALVSPAPREKAGTIEAPLLKVSKGKNIEQMQVDPAGDAATTDYQVRDVRGSVAWVEFRPHTGRTHQIRVHAAHIGCPLLGDQKYGGDDAPFKNVRVRPRVMLHAASITFEHPKSGQMMTVTAPLPDDFRAMMQAFEFSTEGME